MTKTDTPLLSTIKILRRFAVVLLMMVFWLVAKGAASDRLDVYVVNYPLKYFAERIGGDQVNVVFPAPAEIDPAYWTPDTETIAGYQQADLILLNGAGYAGWVNKVSLPRTKLVNTSKDFRDQYITIEGTITHSHGPGDAHAHAGVAFTTWIDFSLAIQQAKSVAEAFSRKKPAMQQYFQENYNTLQSELMEIDRKIKAYSSIDKSKPIIGSHPVYDYLSRRYKLDMKSVHWEPDEAPTNVQWAKLKNILAQHPAQWMIWEGKPLKETITRLQAIGVESLVFNPSGNTPDQGDFLNLMRQNAANLEPVFQ